VADLSQPAGLPEVGGSFQLAEFSGLAGLSGVMIPPQAHTACPPPCELMTGDPIGCGASVTVMSL
jgi:hypothetical protein